MAGVNSRLQPHSRLSLPLTFPLGLLPPLISALAHGDYSIQVNISDYLDIYCPHYHPDAPPVGSPETLALYLVEKHHFQGCVETQETIKRWECNRPHAPFGPMRFSEKIQRFTPFSLGFEFLPGHSYYYMSLPSKDGPRLPCLTLRVTVCCESEPTGSKLGQGTPTPHGAASGVTRALLSLFLVLPLPLLLTV
ncbi:ephrin-A4-like [Arapaima gigas]